MDDIQQKLNLIDRQLSGHTNFHRQIISSTPLLFAAIPLMAGIILQHIFNLPLKIWLILLAVSAISAGFLYFLSKAHHPPVKIAYAASICFLCLGAIRLISFYQPQPNDIRNFITNQRQPAAVRGTIITDPYINNTDRWQFAKFKYSDPASSFYLKITEIESTQGWVNATGKVRVQVNEPMLAPKAGDYIQAYCWLNRFKKTTNPGQFDTVRYLERKNVFVAAYVNSAQGIEILNRESGGVLIKIKNKLRQSVTHALLDEPLLSQNNNQGLLQALLLGYRANIDSDTYLAFRKTGLLHFISLSGMHLGILIGSIWWLCKTTGLQKRGRAAICIIALTVFLLIIPPRPPAVRASVICFVFCISFFFNRKPNPLNTLSLAAIILLLLLPTGLFQAGWQLSFASVLGILLFTDRIRFFIYEKTTSLFAYHKNKKTKPFTRAISKTALSVITLFSVGLAAWIGGAGILLYHFYTINPLTSIWTVVVFPIVAMTLTIGYLKIILSFIIPTLAAGLSMIVTILSRSLVWIVSFIADLNISEILIGNVPLLLIICYYSFILFAVFANLRRPLIKKVVCTAAILSLIIFLAGIKIQRTYRSNLVLTCLDVGHGQAILAQMPGKTNVLFDAGSLSKHDVGNRVVTAFLNYSGIKKIDHIIISHNGLDHINGIPEVVQNCKVDKVHANKAFLEKKRHTGTFKLLSNHLLEKGLKIQSLHNKINIKSKARIKKLWPNNQTYDKKLSDNDLSAVILIEFEDTEILLCSDIEKFAQEEILRLFPNLKPEIVIAPHHGSVRTTLPNLTEKLQPQIMIASCNQIQFERQQKIKQKSHSEKEKQNGISKTKLSYTARDGCISIRIDKNGQVKAPSL
jgi:competence protein ComEC